MLIIEDFPIFCNGDAEKMQCSSVNQAHPPGNCTFPHSTCNHASRSAAFFPVFMLLLFKFAISNSPKIGNLALTFPIACGKLINADEAACLISLDADIAQLVERLIRNQQVAGSNPVGSSILKDWPPVSGGLFSVVFLLRLPMDDTYILPSRDRKR